MLRFTFFFLFSKYNYVTCQKFAGRTDKWSFQLKSGIWGGLVLPLTPFSLFILRYANSLPLDATAAYTARMYHINLYINRMQRNWEINIYCSPLIEQQWSHQFPTEISSFSCTYTITRKQKDTVVAIRISRVEGEIRKNRKGKKYQIQISCDDDDGDDYDIKSSTKP